MTLHAQDTNSWLKTLWQFIFENENAAHNTPELLDDVKTAMAWLKESLDEEPINCVYTYTTDDDDGIQTYAYLSLQQRDEKAFQWILEKLREYQIDHADYMSLSIDQAYDRFLDEYGGSDDILYLSNHPINPDSKNKIITVDDLLAVADDDEADSIMSALEKLKS